MTAPDLPRLTAELERLALRALRDSFDDLNATFFRRLLRRPVFLLVDAPSRLGRWVPEYRCIELGRHLLEEHGWGVVVEVLKHEMAHQFVDEALRLTDEAAHGPAFRQVCQERGIDPDASGVPRRAPAQDAHHTVLDRIAKLLALGESPNEHEAQAAMAAAQRLMLKHNIESVTRSSHPSHSFRHIGRPTARVSEHQRILAVILSDHFFVQPIWVPVWRALEGKRGSVLEACGTLENLELAEYVHGFLHDTGERLWKEYKRARGVRSDAERRTFLTGVMSGFRAKLDREKVAQQREGLVWVGDGDLDRYFRLRHPRVRWARYSSGRRGEAFAHGREAGGQIVLHRGVKPGSSSGPRLLPPSTRS